MAHRGFLIGMLGALGAALAALLVFLSAGAGPAGAAFPGQNGKIFFERSGNHIWSVNPDGSGLTDITVASRYGRHGCGVQSDPAVSPDGTRVAFVGIPRRPDGACARHFEVFTMRADGTGVKKLTEDAYHDSAPSWSPDGERLVFVSAGGPGKTVQPGELYTVEADGSTERRLTTDGKVAAWPTWSPDGTRVAFHALFGEVRVMNADGTGARELTGASHSANFGPPQWSPDGQKLLFEGNESYNKYNPNPASGWFTMNADGSGKELLQARTFDGSYFEDAAFSPDGEKLVASRTVECTVEPCQSTVNRELFSRDLDGTGATPIYRGIGDERVDDPSWAPLPAAP